MSRPHKRFFGRPLRLFAQTAGARILGLLSSSLLVVLLARTLDPSQFGVYALFATTYVFGNLLLGLNLSGNLSRRVPGRSHEEASRLLATFVSGEMALGGVLLVMVLASGLDGRLADALEIGGYRTAFRLILIMTWVDLGAGGCLNHLLACKRFGAANVLTLVRASLLGPVLAIVWLFKGTMSITAIAAGWMAVATLSLTLGAALTNLPGAIRKGVDRTALRGAVSFGVMLASQSFAFYFLKLADRYVLARYATLHDIGIYSFAYTLSNIAYSLSALVLVGLFQPHIVEAHNRSDFVRRDALLAQLTRSSLAAVLLVAGGMALFSQSIIFFARPTYLESSRVLPWLLLTLVPVVAAFPASILLMLEGKLWASVIAGMGAIAVAVPINLILIPRISYQGALVASLVGFCVLAGIQHSAARSWRFLRPAHLGGLRDDLRTLLRMSGRPREPSDQEPTD